MHILENVMLPSVRVWILVSNKDGIQKWFARRPEIELILWTLKLSDLNVIEHMWAELK